MSAWRSKHLGWPQEIWFKWDYKLCGLYNCPQIVLFRRLILDQSVFPVGVGLGITLLDCWSTTFSSTVCKLSNRSSVNVFIWVVLVIQRRNACQRVVSGRRWYLRPLASWKSFQALAWRVNLLGVKFVNLFVIYIISVIIQGRIRRTNKPIYTIIKFYLL